jgi:PAS domain S-box-containing protein
LGQPVEVALTLSPIRSENGAISGISAITHDLSDRKRAEQALSQERFLVETMMDNIPDHIYFKDRESRFIRVNKSMAGRFRLKHWTGAVGKSDFDFFTAEHAQQAFDDEQQIIRTGKPMIDREEKETWPDESVSWVSTTKQCLLDRLGNTIGTFGLSRDITARKAAEQALADKAEELARSNRELEQFAYVASHDLQEPLRMIASYTQLLARRYRDKLDKDASEFIGYAVEGATRMQVLINDLLNYSRLGTRGKPFAPTDCDEVLTRALENLKITIEDAKATVTSSQLPEILGDGTQLTQLFQNLVSNAVKFRGDKPPEVHVSAELKSIPAGRASPAGVSCGRSLGEQAPSEGPNPQSAIENPQSKEWVISVQDNGIGIEPQYFERIFVIFQRLHTREQYPGTGIGLAVCKKIVERHGGRIWVESSPGTGTHFYFTIPQLQSEP